MAVNSKSTAIAGVGEFPKKHNDREKKVIQTAESFSPTTAADWDDVPATISAALDELAARVKALETP